MLSKYAIKKNPHTVKTWYLEEKSNQFSTDRLSQDGSALIVLNKICNCVLL